VDVGLWQYNNTSTKDAYININIAGVSAGKKVTLAFANGNKNQALMTPSIGINGSSSLKTTAAVSAEAFDFKAANAAYYNALSAKEQRRDTLQTEHDAAHSKIQQANQLTLKTLEAERVAISKMPRQQAEALFNQSLAAQKILAAPALNATRTWLDTYPTTPVSYPTINKFVCALPSGRSLVFWQDTAATMSAASLQYFTDNSCGTSGTFARLNTLLGDVWGTHTYSSLIKDTANSKQDINIVFLNMGTTTNLAGYFASGNSFTSGTSNKALAFFVNAARVDLDPQFYLSTLIHEATHMTAFYQNTVIRNKSWNDIWLDETFAMMSEDIVVPAVTGYDKVLNSRLPKYLLSGANVSLNNWPMLSSSHYNMGAAFGAFLNRRYGLSVYQQLITGCTATTALKTNAYDCLNSLIVKNGGTGITEELGKMGATVFSRASASNALPGYGFGSKTSGGYTLMGFDLSGYTLADSLPMTSYGSMSQTYLNETVATGVTRYIRSNVRVPARTRLDLVIK
jgi:hypothetical protein